MISIAFVLVTLTSVGASRITNPSVPYSFRFSRLLDVNTLSNCPYHVEV